MKGFFNRMKVRAKKAEKYAREKEVQIVEGSIRKMSEKHLRKVIEVAKIELERRGEDD